jgi:hypothetical protein
LPGPSTPEKPEHCHANFTAGEPRARIPDAPAAVEAWAIAVDYQADPAHGERRNFHNGSLKIRRDQRSFTGGELRFQTSDAVFISPIKMKLRTTVGVNP